mgnify:CR=1 FL=1
MIFAAILAGGIGSRMNLSDMPKQFLPLKDKPIIIHTLEKFLMCDKFDFFFVGVHPDWMLYMDDLIKKYCPQYRNKICTVPGGKDRNSTLSNVIENLEEKFGESDDHIIVTHDSVRPFVTMRMIDENIEAAKKYGACDTVIAATDTIVSSQDGKFINDIPNRVEMYQGQTPQSFNVKLLKDLYNDLTVEEKEILTDACKICTVRNKPVYLVKGAVSNMKLTTVTDYKIAQALIGGISDD